MGILLFISFPSISDPCQPVDISELIMKTGVLVMKLIEIWPSFSLVYLIFKGAKCLRTFSQRRYEK